MHMNHDHMLHRTGLLTEVQVRGSKALLPRPVPLSTNQFYEAYDHDMNLLSYLARRLFISRHSPVVCASSSICTLCILQHRQGLQDYHCRFSIRSACSLIIVIPVEMEPADSGLRCKVFVLW